MISASENLRECLGENEAIPSMADIMLGGAMLRASNVAICSPVVRPRQDALLMILRTLSGAVRVEMIETWGSESLSGE